MRTLQIGQTIAFDYALKTASGLSSRIGKVTEVRPNHILIEETIAPNITQFRQFRTWAMGNVNILND